MRLKVREESSMIEALRGLPAYEIIETSKVKELRSLSVLMRHKKTGAKLFLLSNDDENKVFYIGFKTRRRTAPAWPTFWSIPCSAARRSFR